MKQIRLKFFFVTFLFLVFLIDVQAQFSQILRAGVNLSKLSGSYQYEDGTSRIGLNIGGMLEYQFSTPDNSLEFGVIYSQQGMKYSNTDATFGTRTVKEVVNNVDYLVVPIFLKQSWGDFYVKGGVFGGYLMNSKSSWTNTVNTGTGSTQTSGTNSDFQSNLNKTDAGAIFGLGYVFPINDDLSLLFDVTYNWGLLAIGTDTNKHPELNMKNRTFQFSIGAYFGSKSKKGYRYRGH